jgi:hypothetical protein
MKALRDRAFSVFLVLIILSVSLHRNAKNSVLVYVASTLPPYHITTNLPRWKIF